SSLFSQPPTSTLLPYTTLFRSGGSMSSRLFQDVRENKGLAYAVFSGHSSHHDSGMLTIYAGTGKDSLESLKSTIESTIDMLIKRSEEHTSELQSRFDLVCRLLL